MKNIFLPAGLVLLCASVLFAQERAALSLPDAVTFALQHNPQLLRASRQLEASRGRLLQSGRIANPELELAATGIPETFNVTGADEFTIGLIQAFEFPGKRSSRRAIAESDTQLASLELERLKSVITATVKKQYAAVLLEQANVGSTKLQLGALMDMIKIAESQFATGQSRYLDVLRLNVELARLTNELRENERWLEDERSVLFLALGVSAQERSNGIELADSLLIRPTMLDPANLTDSLRRGSIVLKIAELQRDRQEHSLQLARISYYPDFSLGIAYERRQGQPPYNANTFTGVPANSTGVRLGISLPLWFQYEPRGLSQEAEAQLAIAQDGAASASRAVHSSIAAAIRAVQSAKEQLEQFERALLVDADAMLASSVTEYANGRLDIANVLDVYRTSRATRIEYLRAAAQYRVALASLESSGNIIPGE